MFAAVIREAAKKSSIGRCTTLPMSTTNLTTQVATIGGIEPDFYRLPITGHDPYFGLTRSWYYAAEERGWIKLKRLRERGKLRGVTLVPYHAVKEFLHKGEEDAL